eukprot:976872-Prymnesium_polylepis.1
MRERRRAGGAAAAARQDEGRREASRLLCHARQEGDEAAMHEALDEWHVEVPNLFWPQASGAGGGRTRWAAPGRGCGGCAWRAGGGSARWRCRGRVRASGSTTTPSC